MKPEASQTIVQCLIVFTASSQQRKYENATGERSFPPEPGGFCNDISFN
jgi:hypothetical protein